MIATLRVAAALLALVLGAGASALLLAEHRGQAQAVAAVNRMCGDGASSDCETLARSRWSAPLGVPLAAVGLAFYLSLGLLLALASADAAPAHGAAAARVAVLALGAALGPSRRDSTSRGWPRACRRARPRTGSRPTWPRPAASGSRAHRRS